MKWKHVSFGLGFFLAARNCQKQAEPMMVLLVCDTLNSLWLFAHAQPHEIKPGILPGSFIPAIDGVDGDSGVGLVCHLSGIEVGKL